MWLASAQTRSANKRTTTTKETATATEQLAEKILRVDTATHATFLETGFTELVVERSLLVVGKDFVTGFVVSTPCYYAISTRLCLRMGHLLEKLGVTALVGMVLQSAVRRRQYTLHKRAFVATE